MAFHFAQACSQSWKRITGKLPLGSKRWPTVIRFLSLFVGCLGMAASGSTTTFSFWQNAMRAILNQTETDSNVVITTGNVGSLLAFPAGMMYENFGCQLVIIFGCIMASSAYVLLWLGTSQWQTFFSSNPWFVDSVYFFVGFGCIFIYMGSLLPNVDNFPFHQHGKVIGILDAALSVGPTLLSVLYNTVYTNGFKEEGQEGKQNLPGFFLTMCFLFIAISIALILLSGRLGRAVIQHQPSVSPGESTPLNNLSENIMGAHPENSTIVTRNDDKISDEPALKLEENPPNKFSEFPFAELPITKALMRWNFQFLLWQFVLSGCLQITFQVNISTYLRSFRMAEHNLLFTVLNTTLQAVTKFIAGIISDIIAQHGRMPRAILFLIPYALQTLSLFVCIFYGDQFIVLLMTCIFVGAAFGVTWCQTPTLIGEMFGSKHFGSNWGWSMVLTAALGFPYSISFSKIYEAAIIEPAEETGEREIYCYGLQCFTWSFALLSGISFCSLIFAIGLTQNMFRNASERRKYVTK